MPLGRKPELYYRAMALSPVMSGYAASWAGACLVAAVLAWKGGHLRERSYWAFLAAPWKAVTFVLAASLLIIATPFAADPTWDCIDASFMALLAFTTAPWSVGMLYRRPSAAHVYVAACVWLFSASWSYDGYLLLRDGRYPATWFANLLASSMLYLSAGLFWSLDADDGGRLRFAFQNRDWPEVPASEFRAVAWAAVAFMLLAAGMIFPLVRHGIFR